MVTGLVVYAPTKVRNFKQITTDLLKCIIRKTKRSEKTKRSDVFRKTKCSFFRLPHT